MLAKLELRDRRALAAWRPEERRGGLRAVFAAPAALAKPLAWVGIGTAAAAGVTAAVIAGVVAVGVLLVVVPGDGGPSEVARAPLAAPEATSTPTPASAVAPKPTPTATPAPTATPTPIPTATPTTTPTPASSTTLSYDTYDTTGTVTTPGSYAFLTTADDGTTSAVTTYEALRDGTTTSLRIHTSDADAASQSDAFDEVEAGHLIEWKQADDCFVRYRVTSAPDPQAGVASREFAVREETYVFQGCQTGSVPTATAVSFTVAAELPLEHLGGTRLTSFAVVHGMTQLAPDGVLTPGGDPLPGATIAVEPMLTRELTALGRSVPDLRTSDLGEARQLPYWREPTLPSDWRLAEVRSGYYAELPGYRADYVGSRGQPAISITGTDAFRVPDTRAASWTVNDGNWLLVRELRMVAGRPATVMYSPHGPRQHPRATSEVSVYDAATEAVYIVSGLSGRPEAAERVIEIACSLFWSESECAQP
ncbi:MAG: hypothetical protein F4Y98_06440 [Chloroflexi bacterium]|nr:hypothetical protein [Chloroflexota bacterium]